MSYFEQSEEQQVAEILRDLKGHPPFVIANRIVDELQQRWGQRESQVIEEEIILQQTPSYLHKANRNGTFDAICLRCFSIVGSASTVANLGPSEIQHVCDVTVLSRRADMLKTTKPN